MAIINRDLDVSEQIKVLEYQAGAVATGVTLLGVGIPFPASLKAINVVAVGLSGTPTLAFGIGRFIAGSGFTFITGGVTATVTVPAMGTSGAVTVTGLSAGSSLLALQRGDQLMAVSGGANSAVTQLSIGVVVQALQDFKTSFGQGS